MKRIFVLVIICCFIATKGFCQEEPKPSAPELTFTEMVHDFGTIPLNGLAEYEFKFTNTGTEPLIIQNCRASCSCTVPACPREPVKPGESGIIRVKYTTTHVPGAFSNSFIITSNARNQSVRLNIKGEVAQNPESA